MMLKLIVFSTLPAWFAISWYFPWIWSVFYLIILTSFIALTVFSLTFWCHVSLSSPHQPSLFLLDKVEKEMRQLEDILKEEQSEWGQSSKRGPLPVIFGRTVDSQLQLLLEYALRDFVLRALEPWVHRPEPVVTKLKEHLWTALQNLHERLLKVDAEKFIAQDMVNKITQHFERIRIAQTCAAQLGQAPVLALAPHLVSRETELHYLRQTSELLLTLLLPRAYRLSPACHALREVFACKILQPCIDQLTDPDCINRHMLQYLQALRSRRALTAATFAEYIQLIQNCDSPETLRQLRYDIVSQMMQATTLASVRRGRGGTESEARALRRYVQQLGMARAACDAALARLTVDQPVVPSEPQDKALGLHEILQSSNGRRALSRHLERACAAGLVPLWWGAERLRRAPPHKQHALAADLYYTHVRAPASPVHVDKETRRRMEAFLLGDGGVEVFHELQNRVEEALREHYASFLLSHHYRDLQDHLEDEEDESELTLETEEDEEQPGEGGEMDSALEQQSTYARRKLNQLREKHDNKTQALAALRASLRPEARALALLAAEVERLAAERRRLEAHLARADAWAKHLGRWRATVHHAQVVEEGALPQFVIVVHVAEGERPETEASDDTQPEDITTGWVLVRSLHEFQDLHRKLRPLCAELKNAELPGSALKSLFGKSENALQQAKQRAQNYLDLVLSDDRLTASEALYAFLSPSADHLKQSDLPKKNKFSFATLFKSSSSSEATRSSVESSGGAAGGAGEQEDALYLDEFDPGMRNIAANRGANGGSTEDRDGLAEPLYALLGEVFDLRGLFRWLRRTLVTFVQITYGRSINRQIKESVWWACSESMLHSYVSCALHAWWPHGQLAPPASPRTAQEVEETREAARRELTAYVVAAAGGLLGARAAGRGARKLHRTLQDHTHNKLLFYELFELVLLEVFPELRRYR